MCSRKKGVNCVIKGFWYTKNINIIKMLNFFNFKAWKGDIFLNSPLSKDISYIIDENNIGAPKIPNKF